MYGKMTKKEKTYPFYRWWSVCQQYMCEGGGHTHQAGLHVLDLMLLTVLSVYMELRLNAFALSIFKYYYV
jgi:hypothetical protein